MFKNNFFGVLASVVALLFFTVGCGSSDLELFDSQAQFDIDQVIIADYIEAEGVDAYNVDDFGVYLSMTEEGTEDVDLSPTRDTEDSTTDQYVTVSYKGYLPNGEVFDQTADGDSITFALDEVITGWQIAIPEMSKGDKATIFIPSYYGYMNYAIGSIPASSVLIFDIELLSFERL